MVDIIALRAPLCNSCGVRNTTRARWLPAFLLVACAHTADVLPYNAVATAPSATAWKQVTLGTIEAAGDPSSLFMNPPADTLRSALASRVGSGPVTLSASG